jgi:hypothetical protein
MPIIELVVHKSSTSATPSTHVWFKNNKLISIFHFKRKNIPKCSLFPFEATLLGHSTVFMSFTNVIIHVAIAR